MTRKKLKIFYAFTLLIIISLAGFFIWPLNLSLLDDPLSLIIMDKNENLLAARIARDGQWRFPSNGHIPEKYEQCLLMFEDRFFYYHPGFNPFSLLRAAVQNIREGRIVSGGSTLTMQVVRLARKGKPRTVLEKLKEIFIAVKLELIYTKKEILTLYAAHAPFGGNIVGLETASWRYFNRPSGSLSWGEAALLSVLPNQPGLLFPGKNQFHLKQKRDRLLNILWKENILDDITYTLAIAEPVPDQPRKIPRITPHLLTRLIDQGMDQGRVTVSIDKELQAAASEIINRYSKNFESNHVYNAAAIIAEINTGNTIAYIGNTSHDGKRHGSDVDIIMAPRSTGSILKPVLYTALIHDGKLLPDMLIPDIPTYLDGFSPQNFNKKFEGAVPASRAMARSLNVPAVHMLRKYRTHRFLELLRSLGISTMTRESSYYGLSLILGGAEASLWELSSMYASLARILNHYFLYPEPNRYNPEDIRVLNILVKPDSENENIDAKDHATVLSAGAIWHMAEAMTRVYRPEEDNAWQLYQSGRRIAWKTGTSYGNRDAWAIGFNRDYLVGVWIGNADGEGRPGLTGVQTAGPVMFDLFNLLPSRAWFSKPQSELLSVEVCGLSGFRASVNCEFKKNTNIYKSGIRADICSYCQIIHVDKQHIYRVNSDCEQVSEIETAPWFVLPPVQEWFYKKSHSNYRVLPPYRNDCRSVGDNQRNMDMIYPPEDTRIYIPLELNGEPGEAVFELAHRQPDRKVYWHLDSKYLGFSQRFHQMALHPGEGKHTITVIDDTGEKLAMEFEVISRSE